MDKTDMINTLGFIGRHLNTRQVVWALGGSLMLAHYGLVRQPNDIDILVDENCFAQAESIMKSIATEKPAIISATFDTRHYGKYSKNGFDIDMMAGLAIRHESGVFHYPFDSISITGSIVVEGVEIPLASLEDWYVLYQLIPGRDTKAGLIESRLRSSGISRADLLGRMLTPYLPDKVRDRVTVLLNMTK